MAKLTASQDVARLNAEKLRAWLRGRAIKDIPINHYGRCNRNAICKELGITISTIGTNKELRELFDSIDARLGAEPRERAIATSTEKERQLQQEINLKENRIAALKAENEHLRQALQQETFFLQTGRLLR